MKTGLMTWFTHHNYGTALQLAALSGQIKALGHEVTLINYNPRPLPVDKADYTFADYLSGRAKGLLNRLKNFHKRTNSYYYFPEGREEKFNAFINEHVSLSPEANTLPELEDAAENFDVVICGSDQIWSPLCFDSHYYLDFVHDKSRKIAYAPSIKPEHAKTALMKQEIIRLAKDFEHISVREENSAKTLSEWLNKDVKAVLDPALLLTPDEWEKNIAPSVSNYTHSGGGFWSTCSVTTKLTGQKFMRQLRNLALK